MSENYTAIIEGVKRQVAGWSQDGNLILADGEHLVLKPLEADEKLRSLHLVRASRLTFTGGEWLIDGQPVAAAAYRYVSSSKTGENLTDFYTDYSLEEYLHRKAETYTTNSEQFCKDVVGVVFVSERHDRVNTEGLPLPPAKKFEPILLSEFYSLGTVSGTPTPTPDYFQSYEEAGQYVSKSSRTIQNWKRRGWLKVEQNGRKIRIARNELDKCMRG